MSVSDSTSGLSLTKVLSNSTVPAATSSTSNSVSTAVKSSGSQALGQDAFLQLLVTQLQHQDPLNPQDNSAFVSQLAQFSSLEGITSLNTSVNAIASNYQSSQALQASSLVGRSVIAQSSTAVVDTSKSMTGSVTFPSAVASSTLAITDVSGNPIKTLDLGSQSAGNASFTWDGTTDSGAQAPSGTYIFKATAPVKGTNTALVTYLPATVNSVTLSSSGGEMTLNLSGQGSVPMSKVQTIGS